MSNRWWRAAGRKREDQVPHVFGKWDRFMETVHTMQEAEIARSNREWEERIWAVPGEVLEVSDVALLRQIQGEISVATVPAVVIDLPPEDTP